MKGNPDLDRFFGDRPEAQDALLFGTALGKFLEADGRDDEETCLEAMAQAPMCMSLVQE